MNTPIHTPGSLAALALTALAFLLPSGLTPARAADWITNANSSWNNNGNWSPATYPNGVDAAANFNNLNITGNTIISLNEPITLGSMVLGDTTGNQYYSINIGTAGSLTFDVSTGNATLTKSSGLTNGANFDRINVPVTLNDNLVVSVASGLNFGIEDAAGPVSGPGGVIKTGAGMFTLGGGGTNPTHTFSSLTVNEGAVMVYGSANWGSIGNMTLNGGYLTHYWGDLFNRGLGTAANQVQVTGGASGWGMNGNNSLTVRINNSSAHTVVWGALGEGSATGFFNPSALILNGPDSQINASLTWDNPINLNGATRTIQTSVSVLGGSSRALIQRVISDSQNSGAGLIKTGNGVLELNQVNTFTGGVTISDGTLRASGNSALGNGGPLGFTSASATLDLRASPSVGNLSGTSTHGLITAGAAGARLLTVNQSGNTTFGRVIQNGSGTVALTKNGAGTLTLTGNNTFSGTLTLANGSISVGTINNASTNGPLGNSAAAVVLGSSGNTGTLLYTGGTAATDKPFSLAGGGTGAFQVATAGQSLTLGGLISGGGALAKSGPGSLVLNTANAYTGLTRVEAGTLRLGVSGGLPSENAVAFAAGAAIATLDLNGLDQRVGQITDSGTVDLARIDNTSGGPVTLTLRNITVPTVSAFNGQIHNTGGGALTLEVGYVNPSPNAMSLELGGSGGNTFGGPVKIQPNGTLVVSSGQESSLGTAVGDAALTLNGGTLRVSTADLAIDDPGRHVFVDGGNFGSHSGGTFNIDSGRVLSIANNVVADGVALRKAGAGTVNLTGITRAGTYIHSAGVTDIDGGDLRVNALTVSGGTFNWGSGRLSLLNRDGADGGVDYSSTTDPTGPLVRVGRTLSVTGNLATDPGSVLELHGSPTFYENNSVRFNQMTLSGILDLSASGDFLEVDILTALLRGDAGIEYGSVPLISAAQITGTFDTFGTVSSGSTFDAFTGSFTSASALDDDTWYLQYADTGDVDALPDTLFFHYRLTPTLIEGGGWAGVPEPETATLAALGMFALRYLRRRQPGPLPELPPAARRLRRKRAAHSDRVRLGY